LAWFLIISNNKLLYNRSVMMRVNAVTATDYTRFNQELTKFETMFNNRNHLTIGRVFEH